MEVSIISGKKLRDNFEKIKGGWIFACDFFGILNKTSKDLLAECVKTVK